MSECQYCHGSVEATPGGILQCTGCGFTPSMVGEPRGDIVSSSHHEDLHTRHHYHYDGGMAAGHVHPIPKIVDKTLEDIAYLRTLRNEELDQEIMKRKWYVRENDLIGGHCIMLIDAPPSCGVFEVADFISKESAEHIVQLHNTWLIEDAPLPKSFADYNPPKSFGPFGERMKPVE